MKFEHTLQFMMDFYAELFPTRKQCLNHLFCTIGNGYEWENGELVDHDHDELLKRWTISPDLERAQENKNRINFYINCTLPRMKLMAERLHEKYEFWYPLDKDYSHLFHDPADMQDDWREGVKECIECLRLDGIEVDMGEESAMIMKL